MEPMDLIEHPCRRLLLALLKVILEQSPLPNLGANHVQLLRSQIIHSDIEQGQPPGVVEVRFEQVLGHDFGQLVAEGQQLDRQVEGVGDHFVVVLRSLI
jgi:hypothetical protein